MGKAIPLEEQKERLVGKRFGTLTVVGYAGHGKWNHKWKCTCDCGWHDCKGNVVVEGGMHSLESGKKTSCSGAHKRINLRGRVFDKLTVLEFAYIDKAIYWKCRCNCGHPLCKGTVIKKGWEMIE